jgi:AbiV family abortive infection protein
MAACDRMDAEKTNTPPKPPMVEIPTSKIDDGLRICDRNIRQFVKDARILLKESSDYRAIALAIFAFEELAKYSELKKAKESATESTVKIDRRLLGGPGAHSYKQNLARKLIPPEAMIVMAAAFDPAHLTKYFMAEDVKVSPILRLDCIFVNWKEEEGTWDLGCPVLPNQITNFTDAILNELERLYRFKSASP